MKTWNWYFRFLLERNFRLLAPLGKQTIKEDQAHRQHKPYYLKSAQGGGTAHPATPGEQGAPGKKGKAAAEDGASSKAGEIVAAET